MENTNIDTADAFTAEDFLDYLSKITPEEAEQTGQQMLAEYKKSSKNPHQHLITPPWTEHLPIPEQKPSQIRPTIFSTEPDDCVGLLIWNSTDHKYYNFHTPADLHAFSTSLHPDERTLHERFHEKTRQKLHLDVDDQNNILDNNIIYHITTKMVEVFNTLYAPDFIMIDKILVSSSSCPNKNSFHLIVQGFCVDYYKEAKLFAERVCSLLEPEIAATIDIGHHKKRTGLRIAESVKIDKVIESGITTIITRPKRIPIGFTFEDTLITHTENCKLVTAGATLTRYLEDKQTQQSHQSQFPPIKDTEVQTILDAIPQKYKINSTLRKVKGNQLFFYRTGASYCEICNREHTNDNTQIITVIKNKLFLGCFRGGTPIHIGNINNINTTKKTKTKKQPKNRLENAAELFAKPPTTTILKLNNTPNNVIYQYKPTAPNNQGCYMEEYPITNGKQTLLVKAPMGAGKTKTLITYINIIKPRSILMISFRQTFSIEMGGRMKLISYQHIAGEITSQKHPFVIVQYESLHRVATNSHYDLIIIDEIESVIEQSISKTNKKNLKLNYSNFRVLLKSCDRLVCMDAYLSQPTVDIIQTLRSDITLHINTIVLSDATHYITTDRVSAVKKVFDLLAEGAKIVIPSTEFAFTKSLHAQIIKKFPEKKIKIYNVETPGDIKAADFSNVNDCWNDLDVLIYTPTLLAGVSFENHHFTHSISFWNTTSANVYSCLQMNNRIRNIQSNTYIHCVAETKSDLLETPESILDYVSLSIKNVQEYNLTEFEFDYENDRIKYNMTPFFTAWLFILAKQNYSHNHFTDLLINELKLTGGTVKPLESFIIEPERKHITTNNNAMRSEIKTIDAKNIIEARELTADEYSHLKNRSISSPDDRLAVQKYRFRKIFNYESVITEKILEKYNTRSTIGTYLRRKRLSRYDDPWDVIKCARNQLNFSELDIDNIQDLLNTNRDQICLEIMKLLNVDFKTTKKISSTDLKELLVKNYTTIQNMLQYIHCTFQDCKKTPLPSLDDKLFLKKMLEFINGKLESQYDITIKASNSRRTEYELCDNLKNLYDENWNIKL